MRESKNLKKRRIKWPQQLKTISKILKGSSKKSCSQSWTRSKVKSQGSQEISKCAKPSLSKQRRKTWHWLINTAKSNLQWVKPTLMICNSDSSTNLKMSLKRQAPTTAQTHRHILKTQQIAERESINLKLGAKARVLTWMTASRSYSLVGRSAPLRTR